MKFQAEGFYKLKGRNSLDNLSLAKRIILKGTLRKRVSRFYSTRSEEIF
jgi:hypothetical protein